MESRFRVFVRVRPLISEDMMLFKKQTREERAPVVCTKCHEDGKRIFLVKPYYDDREFIFDKVISPELNQEESFDFVGKVIVDEVLNGYNGTIMAYGQTGSGKTFTVFGSRAAVDSYGVEMHNEAGLVPRSIKHIFEFINANLDDAQFQVTVSFSQIYMEMITDLLNPAGTPKGGLQIREDPKSGIFINGLMQRIVTSEEEVMRVIRDAAKARSTNATSMNKTSSRSHAVLQVFLEQRWIEEGPPKKRRIKRGLLTIVDLAGSERLSKSNSEGLRLNEAKNINKSISALGNCVAALTSETARNSIAHVPFRDSKLTRLLTDSLGGNSKTFLYACVGPSLLNYDETYSTLLFATRAMDVKTFAKLNENIDYKMINNPPEGVTQRNILLETHNAELRQELDLLKFKLSQKSRSPSPISGEMSPFTTSMLPEDCKCEETQRELVAKFTHMIQYLQAEIARLNVVIAQLQSERQEEPSTIDALIEKLLTVPELRDKIQRILG